MVDENTTPQDEISSEDRISAPLPQRDNPVSEPEDIPINDKRALDDKHPATDNNLQTEEDYDEGVSAAAEAAEPNQTNAVNDFHPPDTTQP